MEKYKQRNLKKTREVIPRNLQYNTTDLWYHTSSSYMPSSKVHFHALEAHVQL